MGLVKHTFCRICSPNCPLEAEIGADGEVTALRPDRDHPVSQGYVCNKGLAYLDIHHDPDRLNWPLRRTNPRDELPAKFERVGWEEAFSNIGERLRAIRDRHGPDAIGVYAGNPIAFNSKAFYGVYTLAGRAGLRRSFNAGTQDLNNKFAASAATFGALVFPVPDFYHTNYLLCFGTNPRISRWTLMSVNQPVGVLQDIIDRGGKVRHVNPRRIESVGPRTGELVQIKPDTDVYLIAALLNEIDAAGGFKEELIAERGKNLEGLRAFIRRYPAERVAPVVGIEAEEIRTIAREFMQADGAATHNATGLNQSRQGTLGTWLLHMLSFVTGNLGRKGGEYYARGYAPTIAPAAFGDDLFDSEFGPMRHVFGALPGALLADFIELEENPVRALIVFSGNPLLSIGGEERLRKAFPKLELVVMSDIYCNSTGEYADYLLPAADWLEREDINATANGSQQAPYAQYTEAMASPRHERMDDWWILTRLEEELGVASLPGATSNNPMGGAEALLSCAELSIEALRAAPHNTVLLPQGAREAFFEQAVLASDRKIDCCPDSFAEAFERAEAIFHELADEAPGAVKLISLRTNSIHNGSLSNSPTLKKGKGAFNPLHIHPDDAQSRGLGDGDLARVFNRYGEVVTPVVLDDTLRPGVVAISHGYGQTQTPGLRVSAASPGVNVNLLMPTGPGTYEPLSNMSHMTGVPVEVEKAASA